MLEEDYYGEIGCCLTCTDFDKEYEVDGYEYDEHEGTCLCFSCKCRECTWYETTYNGGYCRIAWMGLTEITADWHRNCITVKIKHAKNDRFKKIIDVLKSHGFIFIDNEKIWLKTIDKETLYDIRRDLRDITVLKYHERGRPPSTVKQSRLDTFFMKSEHSILR